MRNYNFEIISTLALCLLSQSIVAQKKDSLHYHQYLQDVFQSELVYPQEKNEFQFTLLAQSQRSPDYKSINIPFNAEFGLTNSWQISLGLSSFTKTISHSEVSFRGADNFQIGSKYSFMNIGNTNFHAAIGFELGIPTRKINPGENKTLVSYEPYISLAVDFPGLDQIQLFSMTGIEFFSQRNRLIIEHEPTKLNSGVGLLVPYKFIVFTSEFSCETNILNGGHETELYFTPGIILNLPGEWEAGIGIPIGLNQQSGKNDLTLMLTFEFN